MKTTLSMLAILLAVICAVPTFASCPLKNGKVTGGACTINDIKNLEKNKTQMQEKVNFNLKGEKNLRPVRISPMIKNPDEESCIFCLQKAIFGE